MQESVRFALMSNWQLHIYLQIKHHPALAVAAFLRAWHRYIRLFTYYLLTYLLTYCVVFHMYPETIVW